MRIQYYELYLLEDDPLIKMWQMRLTRLTANPYLEAN